MRDFIQKYQFLLLLLPSQAKDSKLDGDLSQTTQLMSDKPTTTTFYSKLSALDHVTRVPKLYSEIPLSFMSVR